jgi:hypothetical protein
MAFFIGFYIQALVNANANDFEIFYTKSVIFLIAMAIGLVLYVISDIKNKIF